MIYLHRANTIAEIERANAAGWGTEVDVRTMDGQLVVAHDAQLGGSASPLLFEEAVVVAETEMLIDFKESGIVEAAIETIKRVGRRVGNFVGIDLIVPDMLRAERLGLRTLARKSRYETIEGPFWGYWVDYALECGELEPSCPRSVLVSPELHRRPLTREYVSKARSVGFSHICTDYPGEWA